MTKFRCSLCGHDLGWLSDNPTPGHAKTCPRRGGHVEWLTMMSLDAPGIVAQCRDGHGFWEGERRTGPLQQQHAAALDDLQKHNREAHNVIPAPLEEEF